MSAVQKTYRVWNGGCGGWRRVTTSTKVWRATPRWKGLLLPCLGGLGGTIATVGWLYAHPLPLPAVEVVHVPEPSGLAIMIAGLLMLLIVRAWK